jgi:hypothetical protein
MLPSRSASAKARSASARSARKRLGCQPPAVGRVGFPVGWPVIVVKFSLVWLGASGRLGAWAECRRDLVGVPGDQCGERVPGADSSLKQGQDALGGRAAGGSLSQLVQHDLEVLAGLGEIGVVAAEPGLVDVEACWW